MKTSGRQTFIITLAALFLVGPWLFSSAWASSSNPNGLSREEERLLILIKEESLYHMEQLSQESQEMASCFDGAACPADIQADLDDFYQLILLKNTEYRRLTGLIRANDVIGGQRAVAALPGLPAVTLEMFGGDKPSEVREVLKIYAEDSRAADQSFAEYWQEKRSSGGPLLKDKASEEQNYLEQARNDARQLYEAQIRGIIQTLPFIMFLNSKDPTREDIARAFEDMNKHAQQSYEMLNDENKTELVQFANFAGIVELILKRQPQYQPVYDQLMKSLTPEEGVLAWVRRNYIRVGFTSCFFVASVVQAWPLVVGCGSALISSTTYKLYKHWKDYRHTRQTWVTGLSTFQQLRKSRERFVYQLIMEGVIGQAYWGMIKSVKSPLVEAMRSAVVALRTQFRQTLRSGTKKFGNGQLQSVSKDGAAYQASHLSVGPSGHYTDAKIDYVELTRSQS